MRLWTFVCHKSRGLIDRLRNLQLFKENPVIWSELINCFAYFFGNKNELLLYVLRIHTVRESINCDLWKWEETKEIRNVGRKEGTSECRREGTNEMMICRCHFSGQILNSFRKQSLHELLLQPAECRLQLYI